MIIENKMGNPIDYNTIEEIELQNPDGFGILFLDTMEVVKDMKYLDTYELLNSGRPYIAHYRYATVGVVSEENTYPIKTNDGYLFQNGTVKLNTRKDETDAHAVARLLDNSKDKKMLLDALSPTRFCYVHKEGKQYTIQTSGKWYEKDGIRYSKNNISILGGNPFPTYKKYKVDSLYGDYNDYEGFNEEDYYTQNEYLDSDYSPGWSDEYPLAVYGTLKKGKCNNAVLGDSEYIGKGLTEKGYKMEISGIPFVYKNVPGTKVAVELYWVDPLSEDALDALEGHPELYKRELTNIISEDGSKIKAWMYFYQDEPNPEAPDYATF